MNYQLILIGVGVLCVLLFLFQWFRQVRHALHGATRPLRTHAALNWCLLIVAVLAGAGIGTSNIKTEAAAGHEAAETSSSSKVQQSSRPATSSSQSQAEKTKAVAVDNNRQGSQDQSKPAPAAHQQLKLDQTGHAALNNFPVPAKNQLQIVDGANGDVLQTFPGQPNAGTINYTFNKEGNYYLIFTDGPLAKTTVVNVSR